MNPARQCASGVSHAWEGTASRSDLRKRPGADSLAISGKAAQTDTPACIIAPSLPKRDRFETAAQTKTPWLSGNSFATPTAGKGGSCAHPISGTANWRRHNKPKTVQLCEPRNLPQTHFEMFKGRENPRLAVAVEGAVTRPLPARIPACGIIAPGSSDSLASATRHRSWRRGYPPQGGSPC